MMSKLFVTREAHVSGAAEADNSHMPYKRNNLSS